MIVFTYSNNSISTLGHTPNVTKILIWVSEGCHPNDAFHQTSHSIKTAHSPCLIIHLNHLFHLKWSIRSKGQFQPNTHFTLLFRPTNIWWNLNRRIRSLFIFPLKSYFSHPQKFISRPNSTFLKKQIPCLQAPDGLHCSKNIFQTLNMR